MPKVINQMAKSDNKRTNLQTQTLQVGVGCQRSAQHRTSNTVESNFLFHLFWSAFYFWGTNSWLAPHDLIGSPLAWFRRHLDFWQDIGQCQSILQGYTSRSCRSPLYFVGEKYKFKFLKENRQIHYHTQIQTCQVFSFGKYFQDRKQIVIKVAVCNFCLFFFNNFVLCYFNAISKIQQTTLKFSTSTLANACMISTTPAFLTFDRLT